LHAENAKSEKTKIMRYLFFGLIILISAACQPNVQKTIKPAKIPIKVVVLSMFEKGSDEGDTPGEFQYWVENLPLKDTLAFDYGISGVDPADAPTGSAAWANFLVDGDLSHQIDAREIEKGWKTGYIPLRRTTPYAQPVAKNNEGVIARLDSNLVQWAYNLTKDIELPDNEEIKGMREQYKGYAASTMKPHVLIGDQLAAATYWHGKLLTEWANDWVDYWSEGKGNFVTSAMEEMGVYHALDRLHKAKKVDKNRLLVLRTASNFMVGSPVVKELSANWEKYENKIPK